MNPTREGSAIVAAWLEEGPNELPESTRRAIAVDVRTTRQSRRSPWFPFRFRVADRLSVAALAAVAVMALVIGGLVVRPFTSNGSNVGGPPPAPSASPTAMSALYVSGRHGYSIRYPADWSVEGATEAWSPPDWKAATSLGQPFDFISDGGQPPILRAASAPLPDGVANVDDWIDEFLIFGDPNCVPPRETQEEVSIDGAPGRIWDSCGEVEATIVLDGRVYMFTLFLGSDLATNGRAIFDALAATIDLRPEDAVLPSPSSSPDAQTVGGRVSREMPRDRAR